MGYIAAVLAIIVVIVMVLYFRQFSRLQDVIEDRGLLTVANHSLTTQRDNWMSNYERLSLSAQTHSDKLVAILDFLMEEAKVDALWVLEKGGLDKAVMEYVHSLKSALKAEAEAGRVQKHIIDKLRSRRVQMISRIMLLAYGSTEHIGQWDVAMNALEKKLCALRDFKSRIGGRLDQALFTSTKVQEPDTGTTRPDTLDGLATVLGKDHDISDPRADVMPGLDPSLRGEAVLAASAGAHGDEASSR